MNVRARSAAIFGRSTTRWNLRLALAGTLALAASLLLGTSLASAAVPAVSIEAATEIGFTVAKAAGKVDPQGEESSCHFEYVTEAQFEATGFEGAGQAPCDVEPLTGSDPIAVHAQLSGLASETTYHLRLVASNEDGPSEAIAPSFETETATFPALTVKASSEVGFTKAKISGEVDPEGGNQDNGEALPILWQLQYRRADEPTNWQLAEPESTNPIEGAQAESSGGIEVKAGLQGLTPGTEYRYRLLASYAGHEVLSPEESELETEAAAKATVTGLHLVSKTSTEAHFEGEVDTHAPKDESETSPAEEEAFGAEWSFDLGGTSGHAKADDQAEVVHGEVQGLIPNTPYTVTFKATNAGGSSEETIPFTTDGIPPTLAPEVSTAEGEGEVTIRGFVNPNNTPVTDCHFEYGTSVSYGQSAPCEGDPNGPGPSNPPGPPARVSAKLTNLNPGATLHYRLVADNGVGPAVDGPDETVDVPAAPEEGCPNAGQLGTNFLPNCRAYEMVSPSNKNGGNVLFDTGRTRAAADGNAIQFSSISAFGDVVGTGVAVDYMAIRDGAPGTNVWSTHAITPPQGPLGVNSVLTQDPAYLGDLSPDLSRGIFRTATPLTNDPSVAEVPNLYLRNDLRTPGEGSYQLATPCPLCEQSGIPLPPINEDTAARLVVYVGASDDFHHVVFQALDQLTEDSPSTPTPRTYEWDQGQLRLVGYVPSGSDTSCGGSNPPCVAADASIPGQGTGSGTGGSNRPVNVISDDGRRVFFSADGNVYMRTDHTMTDQLNVSERNACIADPPSCAGEAQSATYWGASTDGSRVFFTTGQQLTDEPAGESNLYMYDTTKPASDEHNLTLINIDHEPADDPHEVKGVIAVSDDGSYVYFTASGQLVAGAPRLGFKIGYYAWHEGHISYVGRQFVLDSDDAQTTGDSYILRPPQSRLSADGRSLLLSAHSGVGFATENDQGECDTTYVLLGCRELYLYRADTDQLVCVSCNPSGAPAKENATSGGRLPAATSTTWHLNRNVSDSGRYVFFTSKDALLPEDTNGKSDAYEYDTKTGQLHLLSSGTDPFDSYFIESSADGRDAFILTKERLSGWDTDSSLDVYDARIDGGLPEPPVGTAPCSGESCRQSAPQPPATAPAGSADFSGPGNPKAPHGCPKGRHAVRAKGKTRCVKPHKKHHKRAAKANRRAGR